MEMFEYDKTLPSRVDGGSLSIRADQYALSDEDPTRIFEILHPLGEMSDLL